MPKKTFAPEQIVIGVCGPSFYVPTKRARAYGEVRDTLISPAFRDPNIARLDRKYSLRPRT